MAEMAVKHLVERRMESMFQDLTRTIHGLVRQVTNIRLRVPDEDADAGDLAQELRDDCRQWLDAWRVDKMASLREALVDSLIEIADRVSDSPLEPEAPASSDSASSQCASATGSASASADEPGETSMKGGLETPASNEADANHHGSRPGMVTHRSLVHFLTRNGFHMDPHGRGEAVYKHTSGACLSIPPYHGNGQEIGRGMLKKLRQQLHDILGVSVGVLRGELVCESRTSDKRPASVSTSVDPPASPLPQATPHEHAAPATKQR
jgi:hypothetical protein